MNKIEIKDMDITIYLDGVITSVVGPTNSGKTTLLRKLINNLPNQDIFIDDICIKEYDINFLKNNLVCIFDDDTFNHDYVSEELFNNLRILGFRVDEIMIKVKEILKYFKKDHLFNERIDNLYLEDKILIKILSFLIIDPKIVGIDVLLDYLSNDLKSKIIEYIKEKNISLINVTTNPENILIGEDTIIMNNYKCVLSGNTKSILTGNTILPYMGLKLPFGADLSHNLILYNVIDKELIDYRKLVDKIWK